MNHFRVMVTRPRPQGEILCEQLTAHGFEPLYFPVMVIEPTDVAALRAQIAELDHYDWTIFLSRHAVAMCAPLIHQQWPVLPPQLKWAAVGEGTAQALLAARLMVNLHPVAEWSSEGLLALPELQSSTVAAKKIALCSGKGGRQHLATTLVSRGAEVTHLISYQRVLPEVDTRSYLDLLRKQKIDAIVCTSGEGIFNLKKLLAAEGWPFLQKIPLVLVSERIMILAKEYGFETCFLAKNASHDAILQTLQAIRSERMSSDTQPVSSISGKTILLLCMLVFTAVSGITFFLWSMSNKHVNGALAHVSNQMETDQQQMTELKDQLMEIRQHLQEQQAILQKQTTAVDEWRAMSQNNPRTYRQVLDAQFLVQLAQNHLLLTNNVPLTLSLLNQAENEIKDMNEERILPIKKALEQDKATLKTLTWINPADIYLRLSFLQKQVDKLPMLLVPAQNNPPVATPTASTSADKAPAWWKKGLEHSWAALRQVVIVYDLPASHVPPFVTPDQRPYIYQNLHAVLNNTMWAVLQHDAPVYRASLQQAMEWTQQYFFTNSPVTQIMVSELLSLQAISTGPIKETTLASPKAFQDYLKAEPLPTTSAVSG